MGDDGFGREALAHFAGENLDTRYLNTVPNRPSGVALILVDRQGENSISVASGANLDLTPDDVDAVPDEVFDAAKIFLTCLESPLETVARGLSRAKRAAAIAVTRGGAQPSLPTRAEIESFVSP